MTRHPAVIVDRDRNGTGARHVGAFSSDVCIVVSSDTRTSVVLLAGMPHPSARWPPVAIRLNTMPATSCSKHLFDRARRREHRRRMVVASRGGGVGLDLGLGSWLALAPYLYLGMWLGQKLGLVVKLWA